MISDFIYSAPFRSERRLQDGVFTLMNKCLQALGKGFREGDVGSKTLCRKAAGLKERKKLKAEAKSGTEDRVLSAAPTDFTSLKKQAELLLKPFPEPLLSTLHHNLISDRKICTRNNCRVYQTKAAPYQTLSFSPQM
ncbi:hypothetical protein AMECASPLE_038758 [Ameca splendens]|uniref:Uncharacterized protein n=1 Tax=Ameca splendens TaxID=208324 RepID=A0ABV0XLE7_9TELE